MRIYRALTGSTVRNFVKRVEKFCAKNLPTVHRKIFLPTKAAAKSALLKVSMRRGKKSSSVVNFRTLVTRENFSPLVSVVVPNFNHAPYLRERLETIYKQPYKNFEVILLDDASTTFTGTTSSPRMDLDSITQPSSAGAMTEVQTEMNKQSEQPAWLASAKAMQEQANQQPQGVLQLLQ